MAHNQAFLSKLDLINFKGTEPKAKSSATKRFFFEEAGRKSQRLQLAKDQEEKEYDEEKCGKCGETYYFVKGKNRGNVMGGHNSHCRHNERANSSANRIVNNESDIDERGFDRGDASDHNQDQHESEDQDNDEPDQSPKVGFTSMIEYQESLRAKYGKDEEIPFKTRSKPGLSKTTNWEQYVLIYHHVASKGLSLQDGQHMLDLFHNLFAIAGLTTPISLPAYVSIHAAMTKEKSFGLEEFVQPFPVEYFGLNDGLKPFKGVHFNILKLIAEVLYFADPAFFFKKYEGQQNEFGERVIGDFSSSECFRLLCEQVGSDTTLSKDSVPLCIAVSLDKTTLNSSRSRSATPVTVMIYNLSGDTKRNSFRCEFAGYVPDLPESKHRLDAVLSAQGGKYKYARKAAIAQAEYEGLLNYLAQLLKPLK